MKFPRRTLAMAFAFAFSASAARAQNPPQIPRRPMPRRLIRHCNIARRMRIKVQLRGMSKQPRRINRLRG